MVSDDMSWHPSRDPVGHVAALLRAPRSRRQALRLLFGAAAGGLLSRRGPDIARAEYRGDSHRLFFRDAFAARATSDGQPGITRTTPRRSYQRHVSARLG